MCICRTEIRPGLGGILDYIDRINSVRYSITPILTLMILNQANLTIEEYSNLAGHLQDMLEETWKSVDGIYEIFKRKEVTKS